MSPFKNLKYTSSQRSAFSLAMLFFLSVILVEAQASDQDVISIGIVPQHNASKLAKIWRPILSHLTKNTGFKFQFKTAPSIPVFEERLTTGKYDIAYMNPYHYTEFSKNPGYRAFAKAKNKSIRGIIVVRKDSEIENLSDLNQQTMAFPAPAAFAATVLPMAQFNKKEIDVTPKYVSSHDSVYLAVARGMYQAGGGVKRTLNSVSSEVRDQLKVLWTTQPYTSHPLAAHPRLSQSKIDKISHALVNMESSADGRSLLKRLRWEGVELAHDKQWDDVRGLELDLLTK